MRIVLEYDGSTLTDAQGTVIMWTGLIGFEPSEVEQSSNVLDTSVLAALSTNYTLDAVLSLREKGLI